MNEANDTTITELLFADPRRAPTELGHRLAGARLIDSKFVSATRVGDSLSSLFEMPIGDLVFGAWRDHRLVQRARARTKAHPNTLARVQLFDSQVSCRLHPQLDLDLGEKLITLLTMELAVDLSIGSIFIDVCNGAVIAVGPGWAASHARLQVGKTQVADRRIAKVRIGRSVGLNGAPSTTELSVSPPVNVVEVRRHRRRAGRRWSLR